MNRGHIFLAEWDEEGVFFYQAYCESIASYAVEHQILGGPEFKSGRMTWIKPSLAWMLYRSGYAKKHNQERVLKIKISHSSVASLLENCVCKKGGGGGLGRVQWDPARDLYMAEKEGCKVLPRKMLNSRAIQIGLGGHLSEHYLFSITSVEDVTVLCHKILEVHSLKSEKEITAGMEELRIMLPVEREYIPSCSDEKLKELLITS